MVDMAGMSFEEQLHTIRRTDILLGAHGAGLAHLMFLPQTSVVMEIWIADRYKLTNKLKQQNTKNKITQSNKITKQQNNKTKQQNKKTNKN
jgi:capsular polysaccharide biosynthesis protein